MTTGALLVGGGGFVALMNAGGGAQARPSVVAQPQGTVDTVALTSATSTQAQLPARTTKEFTTLGVTWDSATVARINGSVQVRTRSVATGQWTSWRNLPAEDSAPTRAQNGRAMRGGTGPMWVGPSNGVEVRVHAANGTVALPTGLHLSLVDPNGGGTAPVGYAMDAASGSVSPSATDTSSASATPTDTTTAPATSTDTSSASPSASGSATSTDSASPSGTVSGTPTTSASPTDTGSASASASASASPSATWPSQLPSMAAAYPNCPAPSASASAAPATQTAPSPMPTNTSSPIPAPPIITRAGWGADECIRENGYPGYGQQVKVVFVHHTDDPNTYSCSNSAALVRAAYLYHVRSEGWRDIGYNFLVDKCGQIFEGRFGGVSLPVVGAQTYGFNTNSMGIAAIGTYTDLTGGDSSQSKNSGATPTDAMLRSIAWIASWKLGMSGIDPVTGTNVLTEGGDGSMSGQKFPAGKVVTFNAISGHRDGYLTDCPGNQLYNDLAKIRAYAANPITYIDGGATRYGTSEWITRSGATVHWGTAIPRSQIAGFDVLVDGAVRTSVGSSASQASITLSGNAVHQVQVQIRLASGGTVKSAAAPVLLDAAAPTFPTAPALSLRTGTVSLGAVPVLLNWRAADNTALATVAATAPTTASFATTTTAWSTYAKPGSADLFALRAADVEGNVGTASVTRTPRVVYPGSATRAGTWTTWKGSAYLGGYAYVSGTHGASLSYTFTGRSLAWVAIRARWAGQAYVYVDGSYVQTVNLYNSSSVGHQAVWTRTWSSSGKHTLKIVVVGTSGHPTVATEGFVTLA